MFDDGHILNCYNILKESNLNLLSKTDSIKF